MNGLYEKAGEAFLTKKLDWGGDEVVALLVSPDYTADLTKDQFLSDIPKGARVAVSVPLRGKIVKGFMASAQNLLFERVTGPLCSALVLVQNTKKDATSRLIMYVDDAKFLPHLPNGGDLEVMWNAGIFSL